MGQVCPVVLGFPGNKFLVAITTKERQDLRTRLTPKMILVMVGDSDLFAQRQVSITRLQRSYCFDVSYCFIITFSVHIYI